MSGEFAINADTAEVRPLSKCNFITSALNPNYTMFLGQETDQCGLLKLSPFVKAGIVEKVPVYCKQYWRLWHSGIVLDCWSIGQAINPAPWV